jgi:HKD family nuclease
VIHRALIPSDDWPDASVALRQMAAEASRIQAAIAFVSSGGVDFVAQLRADHPSLALELVARGAPITDPEALERLVELGVAVSVVVERAGRFHPKLWIAHRPDGLQVLTGSGNLTGGGMQENDEQFELLHLDAGEHEAIAEQKRRFTRLTERAVPLDQVRGTPYWTAWRQQLDERRRLMERERELDQALSRTADADNAVEALYADLDALYKRTKAEVRIAAPGGGTRPYVASYFKRAIDRSRGRGSPVTVVANMVKSPTDGFHHLAQARRPDLMVETLVLDASKPYHRLFVPSTIVHARANLDVYEAQIGSARPLSG